MVAHYSRIAPSRRPHPFAYPDPVLHAPIERSSSSSRARLLAQPSDITQAPALHAFPRKF